MRTRIPLGAGIASEGPQGELGGSIWDDPERWRSLTDGSGCPICLHGQPLGVLIERPRTWITSDERAATRGYFCVVSRRHVVEPYQLVGDEREAFWEDILFAAERLARLVGPQKVNYEIHGNTLAHLHAHIYARYRGDRFVAAQLTIGWTQSRTSRSTSFGLRSPTLAGLVSRRRRFASCVADSASTPRNQIELMHSRV